MRIKGFSKYEIYPEEQKIWSYKRNKFLMPKKCRDGYIEYCLYDDNSKKHSIKAHRLFWIAVNGDIPDGLEINHINEDKTDNSLTNLNLLSKKDNMNWGTRTSRAKEKLINGKRSKILFALKDNKIKKIFPSLKEAKRQGYNEGAIWHCFKGNKQHHKGFEWKYMDDYLADWLVEYQNECLKKEKAA